MGYDIPDEVKYREKIVFGMDLRQLCCFCLFALLAFLSYNLLLEGEAKLILPGFFCILGACFILFNMEEKALDIWRYYSGVRKADSSSKKAQAMMGIKGIENDQMILTDGSLRAVLQVQPINFSLLDEGQKAAFISNYKEFLNHLTTPIQILVRTEKSDAEEIFNDAQENLTGADKQLASIFNSFFAFERDYLEAQRVRQRKYYVIVAQPPANLLGRLTSQEDARRQLDQKVKIMQEKLSACPLRSERLDTGQLRSLFSIYSTPETDVMECS